MKERCGTSTDEANKMSNLTFSDPKMLVGKSGKMSEDYKTPEGDDQEKTGAKLKSIGSAEMAKRVIEPYVNIVRKGAKLYTRRAGDRYNYFLSKKSGDLMKNLTLFISNKEDLHALLYETMEILKSLTDSLGARLYFVDKSTDQLYLYQRHVTYPRCRVNYKIGPGSSVASYVAYTKEYICVDDITNDNRFPEGFDFTDEVKPVLCVPVASEFECYAVVELYKGAWQTPFTKADLKTMVLLCSWIGLTIRQNNDSELLHKKQELSNDLLHMVVEYFGSSNSHSLENLLADILDYTKFQLSAERGAFYIVSKSSDGMVADVYDEGLGELAGPLIHKRVKVRIGVEKTVPSLVATSGQLMNVRDVYNDERFVREVTNDKDRSVITRTQLCTPIKNQEGVIGIISMINKKGALFFNDDDETLIQIIATYSSIALHHATVKKQNETAALQLKQTIDLLKYHLKPCDHSLDTISGEIMVPKNIREYSWYILPDDLIIMPHLYVYMVKKIVGETNIDLQVLNEFILTVQCSYRHNPYHNFEHAFNVSHCMYTMLLRNIEKFSLVEREALMIATITHDIDHSGYTNNFLVLTKHVISQLYEESPWENHHVFVTMHILAKYKVFTNLNSKMYEQFLSEVKENILYTDLVYYFKTRMKLVTLVRNQSFVMTNPVHKSLARSMMMTISDLSGQFKPFSISKKITDSLYKEFYNQGDLEKKMNVCPLGTMDRDNACHVPDAQIQFLTIVVLVCADLLRSILPNTLEMYENCQQLRNTWKRIVETRGEKIWRQGDSIP